MSQAAVIASPQAEQLAQNFSASSEKLLCGAVLHGQDHWGDTPVAAGLFGLLSPTDFFLEPHQAIWSIAQSMHNAGLAIDPVAVGDAAVRQDLYIGTAMYLGELLDDPMLRAATPATLTAAAERLKELSNLRKLQAALRLALTDTESGKTFAEVMSAHEDSITNLRSSANTSRTGPQSLQVFVDAVVCQVTAQMEGEEVSEGVRTGNPEFDRVTGGLVNETLMIIAGRPSMGKTAYALNLEQHVSVVERRPTLVFSLEMTGMSLARRDIAKHARVQLSSLKSGEMNERDLSSFVESVEVLSNAPSFIDDTPGLTMPEIRARSRAFVAKYPNAVIFIDYLQIIAMDKAGTDPRQHTSNVSRALKAMARELKVPVVALSQLSRTVEQRANKRPLMSDLRESGQIEQDAEVIVFLYRDEFYNPDTPDKGIAEAIIAKNRDGETRTIKNAWEGQFQRFTEIGSVEHE